jgi:hypothetical protein
MLILKLRVAAKTYQADGIEKGKPSVSYVLYPVYGKENEPWSRFTPAGKLEFTVNNPEAPELEVGAEYFAHINGA